MDVIATASLTPEDRQNQQRLDQVHVALEALRLPGYAALSADMREAAQRCVVKFIGGK